MTCLFSLGVYASTLDACTRQLKGYCLCWVRQLSSKDPTTTTTRALHYSSQVVVFPWAEVCPLLHQSLIQNHTLICLLLWNKMHLQVSISLAAQRNKIWSLEPMRGKPHTNYRNTKVFLHYWSDIFTGIGICIYLGFAFLVNQQYKWPRMKSNSNVHLRH